MEKNLEIKSDADLIHLLMNAATMQEGIKYMYSSYFDYLRLFIIQNKGNEQDAQDIFQEVLVSFINLVKQQKFRAESSIKTFLYSMNRNLWYNELKKRGRTAIRESKYEQMATDETSLMSSMEQRETFHQLITIMNALGEDCKKILLLFYYENYSMRDLLEQFNYENEQVVRNKKYKCLKKLEEMIYSKKGLSEQLKNLLHG
jgi:RNA polymerase sigma factor, sigma-70 family